MPQAARTRLKPSAAHVLSSHRRVSLLAYAGRTRSPAPSSDATALPLLSRQQPLPLSLTRLPLRPELSVVPSAACPFPAPGASGGRRGDARGPRRGEEAQAQRASPGAPLPLAPPSASLPTCGPSPVPSPSRIPTPPPRPAARQERNKKKREAELAALPNLNNALSEFLEELGSLAFKDTSNDKAKFKGIALKKARRPPRSAAERSRAQQSAALQHAAARAEGRSALLCALGAGGQGAAGAHGGDQEREAGDGPQGGRQGHRGEGAAGSSSGLARAPPQAPTHAPHSHRPAASSPFRRLTSSSPLGSARSWRTTGAPPPP